MLRLSLTSKVLFIISAFFVSPATAQQLDKPDLIQSFPVGNRPHHLVFDGANIWVTNHDDGTVMKLRASDGTIQGTFPAGPTPLYITFEGANIWGWK